MRLAISCPPTRRLPGPPNLTLQVLPSRHEQLLLKVNKLKPSIYELLYEKDGNAELLRDHMWVLGAAAGVERRCSWVHARRAAMHVQLCCADSVGVQSRCCWGCRGASLLRVQRLGMDAGSRLRRLQPSPSRLQATESGLPSHCCREAAYSFDEEKTLEGALGVDGFGELDKMGVEG